MDDWLLVSALLGLPLCEGPGREVEGGEGRVVEGGEVRVAEGGEGRVWSSCSLVGMNT